MSYQKSIRTIGLTLIAGFISAGFQNCSDIRLMDVNQAQRLASANSRGQGAPVLADAIQCASIKSSLEQYSSAGTSYLGIPPRDAKGLENACYVQKLFHAVPRQQTGAGVNSGSLVVFHDSLDAVPFATTVFTSTQQVKMSQDPTESIVGSGRVALLDNKSVFLSNRKNDLSAITADSILVVTIYKIGKADEGYMSTTVLAFGPAEMANSDVVLKQGGVDRKLKSGTISIGVDWKYDYEKRQWVSSDRNIPLNSVNFVGKNSGEAINLSHFYDFESRVEKESLPLGMEQMRATLTYRIDIEVFALRGGAQELSDVYLFMK